MTLPDFAETVAKKRAAIRRDIASLEPLTIVSTFWNELDLFWCGKCSKYYNRPLLKFDYLQNGTLKSYQATELCTKCKGVSEVVSQPNSDEPNHDFVQKLWCPSCKQQALDLSGVMLWD